MARVNQKSDRSVYRDAKTGKFVGVIDEIDAAQFKRAAASYTAEFTSSKKKAIAALKRSGYLTRSGKIARPYK